MTKIVLIAVALVAQLVSVATVSAMPIEPRALTWNIVSDREMGRICREHGLRPNCEGMAAWNAEFRSCVIWTRSPRAADDTAAWLVVHHELQHCQEGHFHK